MSNSWELAFIKSGFTGQLPKPFEGPPPNGSRLVPSNMNHLNLEEPTRYVWFDAMPDLFLYLTTWIILSVNLYDFKVPVDSCDFMVDMDRYSDRQFEPNYSFCIHSPSFFVFISFLFLLAFILCFIVTDEWEVIVSLPYLDIMKCVQYLTYAVFCIQMHGL